MHHEKNGNNHEMLLKHGYPLYETNPSIDGNLSGKKKKVQVGNDIEGFVVSDTGDVMKPGVAVFYKYEDVDNERFVKMYLSGIKQMVGMSKSGLSVFELVHKKMQDNPSKDSVGLSWSQVSSDGEDMDKRTFYYGVKELLEYGFLYKSMIPGVFFININYMFNGDRLAFVKGYRLVQSTNTKKKISKLHGRLNKEASKSLV